MSDHLFLSIYICCPGDLAAEREAVVVALSKLRLDGNRFRASTSLPDASPDERAEAIRSADGVIMLLGALSGKFAKENVPAFLAEYHYALEMKKRMAVLAPGALVMDPDVQRLLAEAGPNCLLIRNPLKSTEELAVVVKRAIVAQFLRSFRQPGDTRGHDTAVMDIGRADEAILKNPDSEQVWYTAAGAYAVAQEIDDPEFSRCVDFWNRFVEKFIDNGDARAQLGFLYLRKCMRDSGYHEKALHALLAAAEYGFRDDGMLFDCIGHLYQDKGDLVAAETYFRQAAEVTPARFGYCYGGCLVAGGNFARALPWLRDAAEKYQPSSRTWFRAGLCHAELGDTVPAIEAYKKSIDFEASNADAWFNLGGLYWNNGRLEDAKATWAICLEKFPENSMCEPVRYFLSNG